MAPRVSASYEDLARRFERQASRARAVDLFDLALMLDHVAAALRGQHGPQELHASLGVLRVPAVRCLPAPAQGAVPPGLDAQAAAAWDYLETVTQALACFEDHAAAASWFTTAARRDAWVATVAPRTRFDVAHEMHGMSHVAMSRMRASRGDAQSPSCMPQAAVEAALAKRPAAEPGYAQHARSIGALESAQDAREAGKAHFGAGRLWAAVAAWERAAAIEESAAVRANLAHVRTRLGRQLRSTTRAHLHGGRLLLEKAVADGRRAVALEPAWPRGAERLAAALLALGDEHAAEGARALRACADALDARAATSAEPADAAKHDAARLRSGALCARCDARAQIWSLVRTDVGPADALRQAVATLRAAIAHPSLPRVASAADDDDDAAGAEACAYGDRVARAALAVAAVFRAAYTHPRAWHVDDDHMGEVPMETQRALRACARAVPLAALAASEQLRALAFARGADATVWDAAALDRALADELPLHTDDPRAHDDAGRLEHDPTFVEYMQRSGASGVPAADCVKEFLSGPSAASKSKDHAPHHLRAFGCTLLMRLALLETRAQGGPSAALDADAAAGAAGSAECGSTEEEDVLALEPPCAAASLGAALRDAAVRRSIGLIRAPQGQWAGGEFLGLAVHAAAGIGKSGVPSSAARRSRFASFPWGLPAVASEAAVGGDTTGSAQKALAALTVAEWRGVRPTDISEVLARLYCPALDGFVHNLPFPCTDRKDGGLLVAEAGIALGRLVASCPSLSHCLLSGADLKAKFEDALGAVDGARPAGPGEELVQAIRLVSRAHASFRAASAHGDAEASPAAAEFSKADITAQGTQELRAALVYRAFANSGFGCFVLLRAASMARAKGRAAQPDGAPAGAHDEAFVVETLRLLVRRWEKMSAEKRAGFRWEAMSAEQRARLVAEDMAPVSRAEALLAKAQSARDDDDAPGVAPGTPASPSPRQRPTATAVPCCAHCGARGATSGVELRVCSGCKVERFCGAACLKAGWPAHKATCKRLRRLREQAA